MVSVLSHLLFSSVQGQVKHKFDLDFRKDKQWWLENTCFVFFYQLSTTYLNRQLLTSMSGALNVNMYCLLKNEKVPLFGLELSVLNVKAELKKMNRGQGVMCNDLNSKIAGGQQCYILLPSNVKKW